MNKHNIKFLTFIALIIFAAVAVGFAFGYEQASGEAARFIKTELGK